LSIFHDNQKFNKENIPNYKEVFIDVKLEKLIIRDNKDLYKKSIRW
jgi:adenylylsulfate kinase-like enzyme